MPPVRTLLLIADMGGYTAYMRTHRFSLAHAEANTTRLLKKVIDAAPGFNLIELEGDAAFLSRNAETLDPDVAVTEVLQAAAAIGLRPVFIRRPAEWGAGARPAEPPALDGLLVGDGLVDLAEALGC